MKSTLELTASQEDYLEAISELIARKGAARVKDIAKRLEVAKSSVTSALRALAKRKLVEYEPYQLVTLSDRGRAQAGRIRNRHQALLKFFTEVLDVDETVADANACRIEHAVGDGLLRRLSCFVEFMSENSIASNKLPEAFRRQCDRRRNRKDCPGCEVAVERENDGGHPHRGGKS